MQKETTSQFCMDELVYHPRTVMAHIEDLAMFACVGKCVCVCVSAESGAREHERLVLENDRSRLESKMCTHFQWNMVGVAAAELFVVRSFMTGLSLGFGAQRMEFTPQAMSIWWSIKPISSFFNENHF